MAKHRHALPSPVMHTLCLSVRQQLPERLGDPCRVPEDVAGDTVEHLRSIGYTHASIVGSVQDSLARQTPQAQQQSKATSSTKSLMAKQIIMVGDGLFFAGDVDQ